MRPQLNPLILGPGAPWSLPGSSLDIQFTTGRAAVNRQTSSISSLLTTTRASTGYAQTSTGSLTLFPANTPRITDLGLLVEQAATNLALQSQTFNNAAWSNASVTVTADQGTAPDGTLTADRIVYAGGLGTPDSRRIEQSVTISGGTSAKSFAVAFWIKSNTGSSQALRIKNTHGGVTDTFSAITATTTWQRFSLAVTNAASAGSGSQILGVAAAVADTAFDLLIWQGQMENSAFNTSDIPTTTVAVTRAADVVKFSSVAPFANGYGLFVSASATAGWPSTVYHVTESSGNRLLYSNATNEVDTYNGTNLLSCNKTVGDLLSGFRAAMRLKASDRAIQVNGGVIATDSNTNAAPATVYIGSNNGANVSNLYYKRLAIFSTLTNAQITALAV